MVLVWDDLHHPWSKNGTMYTWEELAIHLKSKIIPQESIRNILEQPPVNLPSCKELPVLGTLAQDIVQLDKLKNQKRKNLMKWHGQKIQKRGGGIWRPGG